ncbi:hypothetical protein [Streptomyces lonarensis]|uniref:Uncharacterized protein n=1 Tax=Streptomyces lonarensis TaxID=700599 RepID=A0A7X6CXF4_9ACTN|nr:hypothetical protein [Streptomyces lonarensis]NJQ04250.1 hypothetical protein [Streptomyces lonarensis]
MTDFPRRIRLYGGRLVHAATAAEEIACKAHYVGPGDHRLPLATAVTCRACERRLSANTPKENR